MANTVEELVTLAEKLETSCIELDKTIVPENEQVFFTGNYHTLKGVDDDLPQQIPYVPNKGAFTIDKDPEDITVEDVLAYQLPDFLEDDEYYLEVKEGNKKSVKLVALNNSTDSSHSSNNGKKYVITDYDTSNQEELAIEYSDSLPQNDKYVITGEALGLQTYSENSWKWSSIERPDVKNSTIAKNNAKAIADLSENCVGLKLSLIYPIYPKAYLIYDSENHDTDADNPDVPYADVPNPWVADNSWVGTYTLKPINAIDIFCRRSKQWCISLKRNFFVDGTVDGKAQGGFFIYRFLFYTEYSLYFKNVVVYKRGTDYYGNVINCGTNLILGNDAAGNTVVTEYRTNSGVSQFRLEGCVFQGWGSKEVAEKRWPSYGTTGAGFYGSAEHTNLTKGQEGGRALRGYSGKFFAIVMDQKNPLYEGLDNNKLDHILIKDTFLYGNKIVSSSRQRFAKSYRLVNCAFYSGTAVDNKLYGLFSPDVGFDYYDFLNHSYESYDGYYNRQAYTDIMMAHLSCPMWFVGNKFYGCDRIRVARAGDGGYVDGIELDGPSQAYVLHNTFQNMVTKVGILKSTGYAPKREGEVYDAYLSVSRLYYCNNTVINCLGITRWARAPQGTLMGKNTSVRNWIRRKWKYPLIIRYYVKNYFRLDCDWIEREWKRATGIDINNPNYSATETPICYNSSYIEKKKRDTWDIEKEKIYDQKLSENFYCYVGIKFNYLEGKVSPYGTSSVNRYIFRNNTLDADKGFIGGMPYNAETTIVHLDWSYNTFKAARISGYDWKLSDRTYKNSEDKATYGTAEYLFACRPWPTYGSFLWPKSNPKIVGGVEPTIKIRDNSIILSNNYKRQNNRNIKKGSSSYSSYNPGAIVYLMGFQVGQEIGDYGLAEKPITKPVKSSNIDISNNTITCESNTEELGDAELWCIINNGKPEKGKPQYHELITGNSLAFGTSTAEILPNIDSDGIPGIKPCTINISESSSYSNTYNFEE